MAGVSAQHAAHKLTSAASGEVIHSGSETALTRVVCGADAGHNQLCLRQIDRLAGASATCGSGIMVSHDTGERELSLESVWSSTRVVKTRRLTLSDCGCVPQRFQGWNTRGNAAGHAGAQLPAAQGAVCHQYALLHAGKKDEYQRAAHQPTDDHAWPCSSRARQLATASKRQHSRSPRRISTSCCSRQVALQLPVSEPDCDASCSIAAGHPVPVEHQDRLLMFRHCCGAGRAGLCCAPPKPPTAGHRGRRPHLAPAQPLPGAGGASWEP